MSPRGLGLWTQLSQDPGVPLSAGLPWCQATGASSVSNSQCTGFFPRVRDLGETKIDRERERKLQHRRRSEEYT